MRGGEFPQCDVQHPLLSVERAPPVKVDCLRYGGKYRRWEITHAGWQINTTLFAVHYHSDVLELPIGLATRPYTTPKRYQFVNSEL